MEGDSPKADHRRSASGKRNRIMTRRYPVAISQDPDYNLVLIGPTSEKLKQ